MKHILSLIALFSLVCVPVLAVDRTPMNIVWIVIEDASPHVGCYGETLIKTPHIDRMAREGIRCSNAFVTAPVCSSSRSAMVSGMYQSTLGVHNHRSQTSSGKGGGNADYYDSYKVPKSVKLIPELFRDAGYYVTNKSKTDYNFIPTSKLYHGNDWKKAPAGQPIFAQFQLSGGKNRKAKGHADPAKVVLPPYYPDHPVLRQDWAKYLDSWVKTDEEVGQILADLKKGGRLDSTAVFLWTDHGVSHLRGKQFLYEEGIRVPMIIRLPKKQSAGTVRDDLVEHIDVAACSLKLAGIKIPGNVQGRDLLASDYKTRKFVFAGRDRCDETVDILRCVRDSRYKYVRNFMSHVPHAQPSQYKDGKKIMQVIRGLHKEGKLNEQQSRPFAPRRPPEELYDLKSDPHELVNLAQAPKSQERLVAMRKVLYQRMTETRDMGLIPEPILEDVGRKAGNKYLAFLDNDHSGQTLRLIEVITAGEANEGAKLLAFAKSPDPSTRYWVAVWLGVNQTAGGKATLLKLTSAPVPAVRIAAAQALCKFGELGQLKLLVEHINDPNLLVGMFALRAIEELGDAGKAHREAIAAAQKSKYEFSRRIARRLTAKWR
ncbi:MAG: sulfatase-like hydrolase/transferase [Opitutae bacterium]|jgi:arylsulfatase A-like enzyme|nr:sulfatase-like hydrolase/transferase [Opitutae bacterium]MBT4667094.1 sulfatase-like hydrolase/transferase [Opitutae bacterium]MBT6850629.1 sulfatase-like hydrolase/transferase [Opitutae bacterium]MBT7741917.1 sulfatase-like hydrolase/transferase [Opitutae bacterium]MBT7924889.1 sulfatase-like hydrolase/transferase [Opitutae bacterium]